MGSPLEEVHTVKQLLQYSVILCFHFSLPLIFGQWDRIFQTKIECLVILNHGFFNINNAMLTHCSTVCTVFFFFFFALCGQNSDHKASMNSLCLEILGECSQNVQ
jgi:hypothetical protein